MSPLAKIPTPPGRLPLIGHLLSFFKKGGMHPVMFEWINLYGPIYTYSPGFRIGIGGYRVVLVDPDLAKQVLVTKCHKYHRPGIVKEIFPSIGNGLFASNGRDHARQRKMINPAFHYSNLQGMVPMFEESANELVMLWTKTLQRSSSDMSEVDVHVDLTHLTFDIIGNTSFGFHFNTILGGDTEASNAFNSMLQGFDFGYRIRSLLIPFYKYFPFPDNLVVKKASEMADGIVLKVINERRQRIEQGITSDKKDLLDLLMAMYDEETGAGMDDEELRAQVFTFLLAGHETTSVALAWTLYELAERPGIQDQIREEIKAVFTADPRVTWANLDKLVYLGNVIKESFRLHPPINLISRVAVEADNLAGYNIPKGTFVLAMVEHIQRSPNLWKNPETFNPDRYDDKGSTMSPYIFLPFSVGPRVCIGNKFAMAEMKVVLSSLLKHFQFSRIPGFKIKPLLKLTLRPDPPLKLNVKFYMAQQ